MPSRCRRSYGLLQHTPKFLDLLAIEYVDFQSMCFCEYQAVQVLYNDAPPPPIAFPMHAHPCHASVTETELHRRESPFLRSDPMALTRLAPNAKWRKQQETTKTDLGSGPQTNDDSSSKESRTVYVLQYYHTKGLAIRKPLTEFERQVWSIWRWCRGGEGGGRCWWLVVVPVPRDGGGAGRRR